MDDSVLKQADILITTYEKMDSILRNFYDKNWIFDLSTIIIDEVHIIGEMSVNCKNQDLSIYLEIINYFESSQKRPEIFLIKLMDNLEKNHDKITIYNALVLIKHFLTTNVLVNAYDSLERDTDKFLTEQSEHLDSILRQEFVKNKI